ncbi:MAG: Peptide chain release factor subunit 1 [Methanosaeta sp. PtaB.Bin039]|nr:MAG: Peptide chain release factor subunit 1 [Methanosaeta sp. PtaB.Bin039]OPY45455.1 MAG: Peptide chain release factor subunit 1 [Methanosaeta sp. PtaU1.Bin028]HOT06021.1 mRNA surveillance protein pelota [Methanotrichaceae archaeon]HQF16329.1 mRNA surveillance protein pelota [Methanotrichaceae archaeon]HQI90101.1 mRNA surveillance protein pelota [Methanotrichaceae archaeon]
MRVLKRDLKGEEGEISLRVESLDDLWHLKHLISPGNLVFAQTQRKISSATDKLRPEKAERRTVRLGVGVESVEFHTHSNWLRIHGVIKAGQDVGSYHTLNIEVGSDLSIIRRWRADQLQRIEEAVAESNRPLVVMALIEEGEATLGALRQFGVQTLSEVRMGSGKGSGQDRRSEFFEQVAAQIDQAAAGDAQVVVAGPGFAKEDLKKVLDAKYPDLASRVVMDDASSIGRSGFQEVLRRGAVERIAQNSRIAREACLIERLLEEVATDGRATYGIREVGRAADFGAVETLLVLDELAKRREVEELIERAINGRGRAVIFSSEFEPGQRLESLGGVAALLRFKIDPA